MLTHKPTEKEESKMTITRKLNNDNGLQDWKTEHQAVTGGIFYCRDSAGFSVSATNKLSCKLTVPCSEIGNKNIPPAVVLHARRPKPTDNCDTKIDE